MALFARLGVPEVWRFDGTALHIHRLQSSGGYADANTSPPFSAVHVSELVPFLAFDPSQDYLSTVRAFRTWVREQLAHS
jgi:hypothetical protein